MSKFNWETFFRRHNIHYVTSGKNTKAGEYSISCVWCNQSNNKDPSEHLGINPVTGSYSCWRNKNHRGNKAPYLLKMILNCSLAEAIEMYGVTQTDPSELNTILNRLKNMDNPVSFTETKKKILLPNNAYRIRNTGSFQNYYDYLVKRKFEPNDIDALVSDYDLRCAITGPWAGRVILPCHYKGELVSWTARAINDADGRLRYLNTSSVDSVLKQTDTLYLYDEVMADQRKEVCYILEGPFDAMKLDFYGKAHGIRSVAMFTNTLSEAQRLIASNIADAFKEVRIMLDTGWFAQAMSLASQITASNVKPKQMAEGFKDVGEMTKHDIYENFCTGDRKA